MRLTFGSGIVCVATWFALQLGAGNVGLQRSISKGAISLVEQPAALILVAVAGLVTAYAVTRMFRLQPIPLLVGVLLGNAFAGIVLAPIAVGELEPIDAPLVFAAVSVLGLQPAAAFLGSWLAARRAARRRASSSLGEVAPP